MTILETITVKNKADVEFTFDIPFTEYKRKWGHSYEPNRNYKIFLSQFTMWERLTENCEKYKNK